MKTKQEMKKALTIKDFNLMSDKCLNVLENSIKRSMKLIKSQNV